MRYQGGSRQRSVERVRLDPTAGACAHAWLGSLSVIPFAANVLLLVVVDMIEPDAFVVKDLGAATALTPTRGRSRAGFHLLKTLGLSHDRDGRRGLPAQE